MLLTRNTEQLMDAQLEMETPDRQPTGQLSQLRVPGECKWKLMEKGSEFIVFIPLTQIDVSKRSTANFPPQSISVSHSQLHDQSVVG